MLLYKMTTFSSHAVLFPNMNMFATADTICGPPVQFKENLGLFWSLDLHFKSNFDRYALREKKSRNLNQIEREEVRMSHVILWFCGW